MNSPPWKCGTSPAAARSSVDLPEPEPPASTTNSPAAISRSRARSAGALAGDWEGFGAYPSFSAPLDGRVAALCAALLLAVLAPFADRRGIEP